MNSNWLYTLMMLAIGMAIPAMAAMNATLGSRLESPATASVILFGVALLVSLAALAVTGVTHHPLFGAAPTPYYVAGIVIAAYMLGITWIAPRFGVGNAVFFVLLGQLITAAAIDHFGLFGAQRAPITLVRLGGVALMAAGVYLAKKPG